MNDAVLTRMKVAVERAVRPVRAGAARKRRMREELFAHLVAAFDQEAQRLGDEQAATARAIERFGDAELLSGELQRTVPRVDRLGAWLDETWCLRPGEPLLQFLVRHFFLMLLGYVAALILVTPMLAIRGRLGEIGLALHVALVAAALGGAFNSVFLLLTDRIARALFGRSETRSVRRASLYALASLPLFPAFALLTCGALTWDLEASLAHLRFACWFAPAAPVVILLMAQVMARESLDAEDWASLEIDA